VQEAEVGVAQVVVMVAVLVAVRVVSERLHLKQSPHKPMS
jgi:hypothetical protein